MAEIAGWCAALLLVGAAGLLPAALLFDRLESRGILYARPLAMAFVALATYVVVAVTPVSYGTPAVGASIVALLAWGGSIAWRRPDLLRDLLARWRGLLAGEAAFFAVFAVVLFARAQAPDAWATEKPADLMFLTAVHHASEFPPADPWLSGARLSYYVLGQVQVDHVARIAGVGPGAAFNLATATAAAAAALAAMGVAADLVRLGGRRRPSSALVAAGVAGAGLLLAAPLAGVVQVLAANGLGGAGVWGALGIEGVPVAAGATGGVPDGFWWWWPTTRVIPGALNEYPAFTVLLGDPHAHLLALPLALVALALAAQIFEGVTSLTWRRWLRGPDTLLLTAGLFAALVMTNAWDVVTFGAIWAGAAWWAVVRAGWPVHLGAFIVARWAAVPALLAVVLAWPLLGTLDPNPIGLSPVAGEHSDPTRWLMAFLPVLLPSLGALAWLRLARRGEAEGDPTPALPLEGGGGRIGRGASGRRTLVVALVVAAAPVVAWGVWLVALGRAEELLDRSWGWVTLAALVAGAAWCGAAAVRAGRERARGLEGALALLGAGLVVMLVVEVAHVDDAFPGRWNTSFKFWFHAWTVFAVSGGALAGIALGGDGGNRTARAGVPMRGASIGRVLAAACGVLWVVTMVVPLAMAESRAREGQERGIDAIAYLDRQYPALAAASAWARAHLDPDAHILVQSVGEAYSTGNLLASSSGIPTVLAWPGHERQWRGEIAEAARRAAVDAIYGGTPEEMRGAVHEWGVTHVYAGVEERAAYGPDVAARFADWPVAFEADGASIFEAPASVEAGGVEAGGVEAGP